MRTDYSELERTFNLMRPTVSGWFNLLDGWMLDSDTWTYASATTFTVSGDVRTKFPVGTKIKLTQTTVKYFYVVSTAYTTSTTVTITGGNDYSLANAAITDNYLSYAETPQGFPQVFAWTPVCTGFSTAPTFGATFSISGGMCHIVVFPTGVGTSNATTFTMTTPIKSRTSTVFTYGTIAKLVNGGVIQTTPGLIELETNTNIANLYTDSNNGAWSNSGNKYVYLSFSYPIK